MMNHTTKREIALFIFMLLNVFVVKAQFTSSNSFMRKAIVSYQRDDKGYYQKVTDKTLDIVDDIVTSYAYNKDTQTLYVLTSNCNSAIILNKDYAKIFKKMKMIPHLDDEKLEEAIQNANNKLDDKYTKLNILWAKHLKDSIDKARADSIEMAKQYKLKAAKHNKELEDYRKNHLWNLAPIKGYELPCALCDEKYTGDTVWCTSIKNDSIFYVNKNNGKLGLSYMTLHACKIPDDLAKDPEFLYHYEAYKDSLSKDTIFNSSNIADINSIQYLKYIKQLKHIAPYGYFESWGWDNEYSMVTFNFEYTNTYVKTIRYIDVYFKITNDVDDVRLTGCFRGTGPLKQFVSATWKWDSSSYFTSGDASNMSISKVIITYMNGTKKVLTGRLLQFNNEEDSEDAFDSSEEE